MNGGAILAEVMKRHGVPFLFTLCGGHISPILIEAKRVGIRVVDVRDEATAVFAADAVARMTGIPGVAAVTAGPGVTNTITALQNAAMAQSPVIVFGGATATVLKGRGALQDIDQLPLIEPIVKWAVSIKAVRHLGPTLEEAFRRAAEGVPGPVFIEVPVDLLYDEATVREWYAAEAGMGKDKSIVGRAKDLYLTQHLFRQFRGNDAMAAGDPKAVDPMEPARADVKRAADMLRAAKKPVVVLGSQTVQLAGEADAIARAVTALGAPTFLGGMTRGLLGRDSDLQFRHKRSKALREADFVLVVGFPFDFRMGYGQKINRSANVISVNRNQADLRKNRRPTLAVHADGGRFLQALAAEPQGDKQAWGAWFDALRERESARDAEIAEQAEQPTEYVNPIHLVRRIEEHIADDSVLVVDGGDFVATAAYVVKPRRPMSWLDPGVFGTLGVGGGFALGAALVRPDAEVWLIYGDGSAGYSLAEIDTFVRHGLKCIAVIGTDASWAQIAREQVEMFHDDVGTTLLRTAYHQVAEGYGGAGLLLERPEDIDATLAKAKELAAAGRPVVINAHIGKTDFRKGSISI